MIYTVYNTSAVGKPSRFFDGNNKEIPYPVMVDTDTGEAIIQDRVGGKVQLSEDGRNVLTKSIQVCLPIRVVEISK